MNDQDVSTLRHSHGLHHCDSRFAETGYTEQPGDAEPRSGARWETPPDDSNLLPLLPATVIVPAGADCPELELALPADAEVRAYRWRIRLEDGREIEGAFPGADLRREMESGKPRSSPGSYVLTLPAIPPGYHRLAIHHGCAWLPETLLVILADSCHRAAALTQGERLYGLSLPLYALRSKRNWGCGDFTDLRAVVDFAADQGAAFVRLMPLFIPSAGGPYEPSGHCYLDWIYLDPEAIPEFQDAAAAQALLADEEFRAHLRAVRAQDRVDRKEVLALKRRVCDRLFEHFCEHHLGRNTARGRAFGDYLAREGEDLRRLVIFEALADYFGAEGFPEWPAEYRDANSIAVRLFAAVHGAALVRLAFLHWQTAAQFESVAARAAEVGMPLGLCCDFPIHAAAGGFEVWSRPEAFVPQVRLAAAGGWTRRVQPRPIDALRATGYRSFARDLAQSMAGAGAIILQDVMDLARQVWIPDAGGEPVAVECPLDEFLGVIALESQRSGCAVLASGPCLAAALWDRLERFGILPLRSMFAETPDGQGYGSAEESAGSTMASAAADEPTLRGFWLGRDLDERAAFNLFASEEDRDQQVMARAVDRVRLLLLLEKEGLLPGGASLHPISVPDMTPDLVAATYQLLCRSAAPVVLVRMEDVLGQAEPVALPGAPVEYANWCRKLPLEIEEWGREPAVAALFDQIARSRGAAGRGLPRVRAESGPGRVVYTVPSATYRLQLERRFNFRQAAELVPYLSDLGISHCYASPYLRARPGSTHGYDIVDHSALDPEIGGAADFDAFTRTLAAHGMGHILDLVPNHMGVMGADNAWWLDVLENGEASEFAGFFDIDWNPVREHLRGRMLLPILGSPYGTALENGEVVLRFDPDEGSFSAWYGPHRLPIDPREYPRLLRFRLEQLESALGADDPEFQEFQSLLTAFGHLPGRWQAAEAKRAERNRDKEVHKRHLARLYGENQDIAHFVNRVLAEFNGTPGISASYDRLHELLEHQAYRIAYWRIAADEINYRRFFDINDLAALSMESPEVFERTHGLVLELIAAGKLHGLRIDHPDGLYDPGAYCRRLQERIAALSRVPAAAAGSAAAVPEAEHERRFYVVVEKILEADEGLPPDWPVSGSTGYEFASLLNGLFICADAELALDQFYRRFSGMPLDFEELLYQSKRMILKVALSSELTVLANRLSRIAERDRHTRDFSLSALRDALREVIACFPVYRIYFSGDGVTPREAEFVERAVADAMRRSPIGDLSVFDFIRDNLLNTHGEGRSDAYREEIVAFAMKMQQLTAPAMAKGMEDTACYRYLRLVSLNEVGSDPRQFGVGLEQFHQANRERARHWPHTLLTTSTHDTKRSEDVRARINVVTEMPAEWMAAVERWHTATASAKREVAGEPAPCNNDEYLIYQTLVGTWPAGGITGDNRAAYRERLEGYLIKALREAKLFSSWLNPNQPYEEATLGFLAALLDNEVLPEFQRDFDAFARRLMRPGYYNSLAQVLLKLTLPGVPDVYQGNELWDFSLVDPDNRRPVDYRWRKTLMERMKRWDRLDAAPLASHLAAMQADMEDGRIKFYLTREALRFRRRHEDLFRQGEYRPLAVTGPKAGHLCAYLRVAGERRILVAVPRATYRLLGEDGRLDDPAVWADSGIRLSDEDRGVYRSVFTREEGVLEHFVPAAGLFRHFSVALLYQQD